MQVKRYVGPNMRLALKQVREEIGPEAVILSSKRLADGGVEIMASLEPAPDSASEQPSTTVGGDNPFRVDEPGEASAEPPRRDTSPLERELEQWQRGHQQRARTLAEALARQHAERNGGAEQTDAADSAPAAPSSPEPAPDVVNIRDRAAAETPASEPAADNASTHEVAQLREELHAMREMLEQQLSSAAWGQYCQQSPGRAGLWRRLKRMGLSARLSHTLLDQLSGAGDGDERRHWQQLMAQLSRMLPVADGDDPIGGGGVYALVGATGAGKTTTIGKLATRYVLEHGPESVALVTTDTARIAAYEQLRTFGRILNVPVKVVDRHHNLEQVLYALRHKRLVLVDTAGLNRQDPRLRRQLETLSEMAGPLKTLLTVPATSQASVVKAAYHTYKTDNLAGCIVTKLDEATSIGEVLSLAVDNALPLLYTTSGQNIPDDLAPADRAELIRRAIELARPVTASDDVMADELAAVARG